MLYVQAKRHGGGGNTPPTRIVIHGTVSPCRAGQARKTADYFRTVTRPASAHYVVDPGEVVQCLTDDTIGYHAPPNARSIGVELCDPQSGSGKRWSDADHEAMLVRAAALVRDLAVKYNIPTRRLTVADLVAGRKGLCGHVDVSNAWHQTTHVDPGPDFPWDHFLDLVNGDDMPLTAAEIDAVAKATVDKLLTASLKNSHNDVSASFAAWVVYGNEKASDARDNAANALAATNLLRDSLPTVIRDAVSEAVKGALTDGTIKVDVTVNGVKA